FGNATGTAARIGFMTLSSTTAASATTTSAITSVLTQSTFTGGPGAAKADLTFSTLNSGALTGMMRIMSNGRVGIGTSSPSATLSVAGSGLFSSYVNVSGLATLFGGASTTNITASGFGYFGTASSTKLITNYASSSVLTVSGTSYLQGGVMAS